MQQSILSQTPHRQHHTKLSSLPSNLMQSQKFQNVENSKIPLEGTQLNCIGYL